MKIYFRTIHILSTILFLLLFIPTLEKVSAHSADLSYFDIYLPSDNKVNQATFTSKLYSSWVEVSYIVGDSFKPDIPASEQTIPKDIYSAYISQHLQVSNNKQPCIPTYENIPKAKDSDIVFGRGVMIPITYTCPEQLHTLEITNTLYTEKFPLQQNIVTVLRDNTSLQTDVLTAKLPQTVVSITNLPVLQKISPTAPVRQNLPVTPYSTLSSIFTEKFLITSKSSLPIAIFIVFFLGMLHTFEAGHSKTMLASYVIQKKVTVRQALAFAGIFTLTHIADLLLLSIVFLITNTFVDIYSKLSYLNIFALYTLLFLSVFMLFRSIATFIKKTVVTNASHISNSHHHRHQGDDQHEHTHPWEVYPNNLKKQIFYAFLLGLSPCIFGWSVFMIILSLKQVWALIPILISLGLGIFTTLAIFIGTIMYLKGKLINRFSLLGEISPIISYSLLAIFAFLALK